MLSDRFYYFAYGSCMDTDSLTRSLGLDVSQYLVSKARLAGYQLVFDYPSTVREGGLCNIRPNEGDFVEGVLYYLPSLVRNDLDEREAVPRGRYRREYVTVEHEGGSIKNVLTYVALIVMDKEVAPESDYQDMLFKGMFQAGLSHNYIDQIKSRLDSLGVTPPE